VILLLSPAEQAMVATTTAMLAILMRSNNICYLPEGYLDVRSAVARSDLPQSTRWVSSSYRLSLALER
jgi:hypothetical protein